ncbi:unnamed protein product [Prunus brigantina]
MDKQAYRIETSFMAAMDRRATNALPRKDAGDIIHDASWSRTKKPGKREPRRLCPHPIVRLRPTSSATNEQLGVVPAGMGELWTDPTDRNDVQSAPCVGCITWAKQPHAFYSPAWRPSTHLGRPHPSRYEQRARCFIAAIRS